jgi:hypothetical protein
MIVGALMVAAGKKLEGPNCLRSLRGTDLVEATGGETDLVELAERLDSHPIFFIFNDQLYMITINLFSAVTTLIVGLYLSIFILKKDFMEKTIQ